MFVPRWTCARTALLALATLSAGAAEASQLTAVKLTSPAGFKATDLYGNAAVVYFQAGTDTGADKLLVVFGNGTSFKDEAELKFEMMAPSAYYDVKQLAPTVDMTGVLDTDPLSNPTYANWNKIWVPVTPGDRFEGEGHVYVTAQGTATFTGAWWPGAILESLPDLVGADHFAALDQLAFVGMSSGAFMAGRSMATLCPAFSSATCDLIVDSYDHHERTVDELALQSKADEIAEIAASRKLWGGEPAVQCERYMADVGRPADDCLTKAFYGLPVWQLLDVPNVGRVLMIGPEGDLSMQAEFGWAESPMDNPDVYLKNQAVVDPIRYAIEDMAVLERHILIHKGAVDPLNISYVFGFNTDHVVLDDTTKMETTEVYGVSERKVVENVMDRGIGYLVLEDPE